MRRHLLFISYLNNEKIHRKWILMSIFLWHNDNFNFRNCFIQLTHSNKYTFYLVEYASAPEL